MLKWVDETRRRMVTSCSEISTESENANSSRNSIGSTATSSDSSNTSSMISAAGDSSGSSSSDDTDAIIASSPFRRRRLTPKERHQRRLHPNHRCQDLCVAPEQISLSWEEDSSYGKDNNSRVSRRSLPNTPTTDDLSHDWNFEKPAGNIKPIKNYNKITTKSELLQISTNQGDKDRTSFWKNLIGKKSWPGRTYKSPLLKSHSVVETYRKIEESYYIEPIDVASEKSNPADSKSLTKDLDRLTLTEEPAATKIPQTRSLKTIKRQNQYKKQKAFIENARRGRIKSLDSGFSDIRLSVDMSDSVDYDPREPGSPSSSTSSEDFEQYKSHRQEKS